MDGNVQTRARWAYTLDPGLRKYFTEQLKEIAPMYSMLYNVTTSDKAYEEDVTSVGLGDWVETPEMEPTNFTGPVEGFKKRYVHSSFTSGVRISREQIDDDQYNVVIKHARTLARTALRKVDKDAANVFNNAFNTTVTTGADGAAMISDSHSREDGQGTWDNKITPALDEDALEEADVLMAEQINGRGEQIELEPDTLVVPPALKAEALRLVKSEGRVASPNNDINVFKGLYNVVVWKRLAASAGGSDIVWFMMDSKAAKAEYGLNIFMRTEPEVEMTKETLRYSEWEGFMRYSLGFTGSQAIVGSTGAS